MNPHSVQLSSRFRLKISVVPKRKSYKYILFFLLFTSIGASAQNFPGESEDAYEADSLLAVRNAVKIDPLQVVFGDFSIYYERILKKGFSLEAGIGFTRRNYAVGWFDYSLDDLGKNVDIKTGYALSLSVRKYFQDSGELYGAYIGVGASLKNYKTDYYVIDSTATLSDVSFQDRRLITTVIAVFGYQALPVSSNVFADFYLGLAVRFKDMDIVESSNLYDESAYKINPTTETALGIVVGVKIGFGF